MRHHRECLTGYKTCLGYKTSSSPSPLMAASRERGFRNMLKLLLWSKSSMHFSLHRSATVFIAILLRTYVIHFIVTFCFNQVSHPLFLHKRNHVCTWKKFKYWLTKQKLMYHFKCGNRKQMIREKFRVRALAWKDLQNGFLHLTLSRPLAVCPT